MTYSHGVVGVQLQRFIQNNLQYNDDDSHRDFYPLCVIIFIYDYLVLTISDDKDQNVQLAFKFC